MLRVKIKEINGEFDREFNLNTTTSDFYYKKFPDTYISPNFSYKSLLDELNISVDILKPYNDCEDYIFLYASDIWCKLNLSNDFIVSKHFKLISHKIGASKYFTFLTNAFKEDLKTNLLISIYEDENLLLDFKQEIFSYKGLIFLLNDILEDRTVKTKLKVFDDYNYGIFWVKDKKIIKINNNVSGFLKKHNLKSINFNNLNFKNLTHAEFLKVYKQLSTGEISSYTDEILFEDKANKNYFYFKVYLNSQSGDEGLVKFSCFNITKVRREKLKAEFYKQDLNLVQKLSKFSLRYGSISNLNDWSPAIYDILEVPENQRKNISRDTILYNQLGSAVKNEFDQFIKDPESFNSFYSKDFSIVSFKGNMKFLTYHAVYLKDFYNESDSIISSIVQDITELHNYELKLKKSNKELSQVLKVKEDLLKEVHNRVKNNLQIILSLLNLNMRFNQNNPLETLSNTKNYIKTISLMHEKTYESTSLNGVNIKSYLTDLIDLKIKPLKDNINLNLSISNVELSNDIVIPFSLIISIIIEKIFKYSSSNVKGELTVKLKLKEDKVNFKLKYEDYSLDDFNVFQDFTDLSFILIQALANQINADLELNPLSNGLELNLIFSKS
ncbi:sensor histidine kinase [Methanobrevibacter sp. UBA412]|jgi:two-component sensor histidine kinase|uniref:sensor histidine kinase n=1 Tax=Methanobrevibacter sp. UBA412 TaxID=1915486 RepID=UPI003766CB8D|nr:sensor histidine kinase [Methanobacteriaceae archaeon]